jgi:hypothetical protein
MSTVTATELRRAIIEGRRRADRDKYRITDDGPETRAYRVPVERTEAESLWQEARA